MTRVKPGLAKVIFHGVCRSFPFPGIDQGGQAAQSLLLKAQCLANLARSRSPTVGNDIGSHRGSELSVALIDILNGALSLVPAWQVQVDIRPLSSLLREEALEQKVH